MEPGWFARKRAEWSYKAEMARSQRLARRFARQQEREAAKLEGELAGRPSISQRFELWRLQRLAKKQEQAEFWQQLQEQHAFLSWLKRHETKLFWVFVLCVAAAFAGYIAIEARKAEALAKQRSIAKRTMVTVNGTPIFLETVLDRAFFAHGASMMQELTEQEVVRQEAKRLNVELDAAELSKIGELVDSSPQEYVLRPRLETSFLVRRLVLRGVTEKRRKEIFKDFKDELAVYSVTAFHFSDFTAARSFETDVASGKELTLAAVTHTIGAKKPSRLGDFTPAQLEKFFGGYAMRAITKLAIGTMTEPINRDGRVTIFRLDAVKTAYEDVQEPIESMIVEADAPQYMFNLIEKAEIQSPYIDPATSDFKDDTPAPSETPGKSPSPAAPSPEG